MITRYTHGTSTWVDVFEPTPEELRELIDAHDIPLTLTTDLSGPVPRSEATCVDGVIKVTLDFPVVKLSRRERPQEIKFLITDDTLITIRYDDVAALHQFSKEFEVAATLGKSATALRGSHLFIAVIQALYAALNQKLDYLEAQLTEVEEHIFDAREKEMVTTISRTSQRLVLFRQTFTEHPSTLAQAHASLRECFPDAVPEGIQQLRARCTDIDRRLSHLFASAVELRETNNALLTTKQNEIMKTLTIMAFVTFPLSLLTSMFGMNTATLPLVGTPGDFWYILGGMVLATAGFFAFFKYKRWM